MPEQDLPATQADHAKEVLDMVVPAGCEPAKGMEPSEKSLDSPTFGVTPQRVPMLRRRPGFNIVERPEPEFRPTCVTRSRATTFGSTTGEGPSAGGVLFMMDPPPNAAQGSVFPVAAAPGRPRAARSGTSMRPRNNCPTDDWRVRAQSSRAETS